MSRVMGKGKIEDLVIYPIKGCRGVHLDKVRVTPMGMEGDRELTLLLDGKRVSQSQLPSIAKLGARYLDSSKMELSYPGVRPLVFSTLEGSRSDTVSVFGQSIPVLMMDEEVSNWLSDALGVKVELAKMVNAMEWNIPLTEFDEVNRKQQSKFIDASPLLLTNTASLEDLNARLSGPVPMDRFRANIVVSGLKAYEEDDIQEYDCPDVLLKRVTVCERCIVTTTDQETGLRSKEPLRTLSKYRRREGGYAGGIMFGMYLTAAQSGFLTVGDRL